MQPMASPVRSLRGAALIACLGACVACAACDDSPGPEADAAGAHDGAGPDVPDGAENPADAGSADGASDAPAWDAAVSPGMALVAAGAFDMGCHTPPDFDCEPDEEPRHTVSLSGYEIDLTEMTQAGYQGCVDAGGCSSPSTYAECATAYDPVAHPDHAVVCVDWAQAAAFCAWAGKRLPTEAEWEKAARGTDGRIYPWGNAYPECHLVRYAAGGCEGTVGAVATLPDGRSPYGLYDMAGNAQEYVADFYDAAYYASSPSADPQGPETGRFHGARGGPATSPIASDLRTSSRRFDLTASARVGFRCARSID